jgi:hypothetical protein
VSDVVAGVGAGVVDVLGDGEVVATGVFELLGATVHPVNKQVRKARLTKRRFTIFGSSKQCVSA